MLPLPPPAGLGGVRTRSTPRYGARLLCKSDAATARLQLPPNPPFQGEGTDPTPYVRGLALVRLELGLARLVVALESDRAALERYVYAGTAAQVRLDECED